MKKLLIFDIAFVVLISYTNCFSQTLPADSVYLILDEPYNDTLPRNFRKSNGELSREHKEVPDTTGLSSLNISGSAEFSDKSLQLLIKAVNSKHLIDIDLRQESHGFVNG